MNDYQTSRLDFLRGLQWARTIAGHMPDCEGVERWQDTEAYSAGFVDGCGAVINAIDAKMEDLIEGIDRPTLVKLGIEFGLFKSEKEGRKNYERRSSKTKHSHR